MTAIPRKRAQFTETVFLERDEVERTLAGLPTDSPSALRDRTLLLFLYNTGARVQEAAGLRASDVHFDPNPRVHLHGKGDKWRVCPLWAETAALLQRLLSDHVVGAPPDRPVFTSPRRTALTRLESTRSFGVHGGDRQEGLGWSIARVCAYPAPLNGRSSSRSRSRGQRDPRMAWSCESGDHEPLRRNHPPYQASRPGKMQRARAWRREDSAKADMGERHSPAAVAAIVVVVMFRQCAISGRLRVAARHSAT